MIDNKDFWDTVIQNMSNEHEKISNLNISIAESECNIKKILDSRKIDVEELTDEYSCLIQRHISMAYTQGLDDGAKLIHTLLSGGMTNHVLRLFGDKADDALEIGLVKTAFENKNP